MLDEARATNFIISADELFIDISVSTLGVSRLLLLLLLICSVVLY